MEEVFARAASVKSIVMSAPDMEAERREIKTLIAGAEADMEMNPLEFMEPGRVEQMTRLWQGLDVTYKSCVLKLQQWQEEYASILDANVETALQASVAKLKQDVLAYKRSLLA